MPLMIAPMALHGAMHTEGECATARAAKRCGIPMVTLQSPEERDEWCSVCRCLHQRMWWTSSTPKCRRCSFNRSTCSSRAWTHEQTFSHSFLTSCRDDAFMEALLKNIYEQGCRYVVLTVDAPIMATREKDIENGYASLIAPLTCMAHLLSIP